MSLKIVLEEVREKTAESLKEALLERLVRLGATDIPKTPRLLMKHRSPEELAALQHGVTNAFKKVEDPVKRVVHGAIDKVPHEGVKKVLKGGANLLIENPETIPMQAVPFPGLTPGYLAAKKGLEKGLDYISPLHKAAFATNEFSGPMNPVIASGASDQNQGKITPLFRPGKQKLAANTAWGNFKVLDVTPTDKEHSHVLAHNQEQNQLMHMLTRHDGESGVPTAYTSFRPMSKVDPQYMEVMSMHVEPEHRGKGYGKRLWSNVRAMHKDLTFCVQPDGFKDKNKTNEELGKVYESYGFKPSKVAGWYVLPPKETTKVAFKLQGEMDHQGLDIAIENRKGSVRSGTTDDGKKWRTVMKLPYGYIRDTKGADGEDIDCYVGPDKDAPNAYVVHQHKPDGTGYDEDKIMLGMGSKEEARKAYLAHYDDKKFLGPMKEVPIERLKEMLESGKKLEKISAHSPEKMLKAVQVASPERLGVSGARRFLARVPPNERTGNARLLTPGRKALDAAIRTHVDARDAAPPMGKGMLAAIKAKREEAHAASQATAKAHEEYLLKHHEPSVTAHERRQAFYSRRGGVLNAKKQVLTEGKREREAADLAALSRKPPMAKEGASAPTRGGFMMASDQNAGPVNPLFKAGDIMNQEEITYSNSDFKPAKLMKKADISPTQPLGNGGGNPHRAASYQGSMPINPIFNPLQKRAEDGGGAEFGGYYGGGAGAMNPVYNMGFKQPSLQGRGRINPLRKEALASPAAILASSKHVGTAPGALGSKGPSQHQISGVSGGPSLPGSIKPSSGFGEYRGKMQR